MTIHVFSKVLLEIKGNYGDEILLVPVGVSDEVSSINLILDKYGVSIEELPAIVINQETKLTDVESIADIEKFLL